MAARRRHSLPQAVYSLVEAEPGTVLLEGASSQQSDSASEPWTRLFTAPLRVCTAWQPDEVPAIFAEIERAVTAGRYAAGFFSYECGVAFEPKAMVRKSGERQPTPLAPLVPLAWLGIYDRAHVFDHEKGKFAGELPEKLKSALQQAGTVPDESKRAIPLTAEFALTEAEYARRIAAIHEWIRAGDVYQLNFTAPLQLEVTETAAALYRRLRTRQPAQYGAFVHWQPGRHILSFSPELFFRIDGVATASEGRRITTRPMKGTAPRGRTTQEDREIADWLRNDEKNRSENLMIVDLIRNDLGRVGRFGTVRAKDLFAVERLPTLWQMTSTVTAELRHDANFESIFRALFPSGSITGAPKVRAMQLIAELEDAPRGVYTGSIGFFSPQQTVFNVAIRTLELEGAHGTMGVGSGIVIDSEPAAEYHECLLKAEFLTRSARSRPGEFSLIETMLWDGHYLLLDLHLDRLADSADYFDFSCCRDEVKAALDAHAREFNDAAPRKVRLLLACDGAVQITDELMPTQVSPDTIQRVSIASARTDPADAFLYHKTTHRPLYAAAFEAASRAGFADVLFFNLRGELTEGAISNVFVEKNGRCFTPPVKCGLLPGVYRRHLLASRPEIEERVLTEADLHAADAIYLANAVRGLRRVEIEWPAKLD